MSGIKRSKSLHLHQPAGRGEVGPFEHLRRLRSRRRSTNRPAGSTAGARAARAAPISRRRCSSRACRLGKTRASSGRPRSIALVSRQAWGGRPALQAAAHAIGRVARHAVVLPEQVHRTDQPVLVRRHDPRGPAVGAQAQDARAADQRNIVKVNDVGRRIIEHFLEHVRLEVAASRSPASPAATGCRTGS